jgi:hypothetical protein
MHHAEDGTRAVQTRGARHGCVGGALEFMLCANRTPFPMRDRCEDGVTCARTSLRCLIASACCRTHTYWSCYSAMREDDRDEDLGKF